MKFKVSASEDNITTISPDDIGSNTYIGTQIKSKCRPNKWFTFTADFNFNYFDSVGRFETLIFQYICSSNKWFSKPYCFELKAHSI